MEYIALLRKYGSRFRRKPRRHDVRREVWEVHKTQVEDMIETSERLALRNKMKSEKCLDIYTYGGLSETCINSDTAQWALRKY